MAEVTLCLSKEVKETMLRGADAEIVCNRLQCLQGSIGNQFKVLINNTFPISFHVLGPANLRESTYKQLR